MIGRRISILRTVVLLVMGVGFMAGATPNIPNIPSNMIIDKSSHPYGGNIISVANFNLTASGASWSMGSGVSMTYASLDGTNGCYWMGISDSSYAKSAQSASTFTIQPNRNYYVSALINCNFNRDNCEFNLGMTNIDGNGNVTIQTLNGIPAQTNGWQRFEWMFTSDCRGSSGRFSLAVYNVLNPSAEDIFYISDLIFIEMPATSLAPYSPGDGMTFGGSSGGLGMSIVSATSDSSAITVTTTGARYTFNKTNNTITAEQLINATRQVSSWSSNKSFANLAVQSQSAKEVVLTNGSSGVTFGVQMDGLLLASTHSTDLELTCTSGIAGIWNRFASGHLIAMDDIGGFTVNPDIPLGTGRLARTTVLTSGLDFVDKSNDASFISNANSGWQIKWTISPGERLGITTFPPRAYDWQASFNSTYVNYYRTTSPAQPAIDRDTYGVSIGLLWDFCKRAWGMSYGNQYIPYDETAYVNYIAAAKSASIHPLNYMSMYFWHNRDIDEYITEVIRHRDTYGIEGIYSDGDPSQEWLIAYEGMRRLREVFPDGYVILHTTGQYGNGGPPLAVPDMFIPAIDAYATITLRGEGVPGTGKDWPYPRFVTSQYNKANCFGVQKGDAWSDIVQADQDLINLEHNGRARLTRTANFEDEYKVILAQLETAWQNSGTQPDFYEAYYAPLARSLIRPYVTEYASEPVLDETFNYDTAGSVPSRWNTTCDSNTTVTVADSPSASDKSVKLYDNSASGKCSMSKRFLPLSGPLTFEFKFLTGSIASEVNLKDSAGNIGVYLALEGGYLKYRDNSGNYVTVKAYSYSTWYSVKIVADTDTDTYHIYVDGNLVLTGATFRTNVYSLSEAVFTTGVSTSGTVYFNDIKAGRASAAVMYETFNSDTAGSAPSRWNTACDSSTTVTVENSPSALDKSVKLYDNNASGKCSITKKFSPLTGPFNFEFKFLTGSITSELNLKDSAGNIGVYLTLEGGYVKYRNSAGNYVNVQAYSYSTWYTLKAVANTDTDTYDIYINGALALTGATFRTNVYSLSEAVFTTGVSTSGTVYFNDIKAESAATSVMYETFNSDTTGSAPIWWNTACDSNTTVTVENNPSATDKSVKLYDNNLSGKCSASKKFLPQSGNFTFEFKFLTGSIASEVDLKDSAGNIGVYLAIEGGYLKYRNSAGSYVVVQAISYSTWYTVKAVANVGADTYDIYVNGALITTGATFRTTVNSLSETTFITGVSTAGTVYFNDIKISNN